MRFLLKRYIVSGHSMEPTLLPHESILVSSLPYLFANPKIGDIVVFEHSGKQFLKRITKIENKKYFVEGDNKQDSLDSQQLGWISRDTIIGKYLYKL